jgi:hypothetical protein
MGELNYLSVHTGRNPCYSKHWEALAGFQMPSVQSLFIRDLAVALVIEEA